MRKVLMMGLVILPALLMGQSKFNQFKAQKYVIEGAKKLYKKQYDRALNDFETAVRLDPYNKDVYQFRGEAYYQMNDFDAALSDFDKAIRVHDDVPELYFKRGMIYENLGYYNQAYRDYKYSLTLNPQYSQAERRIRSLDRRYNDYDEDGEYYSGGSAYPDRGESENTSGSNSGYWWERREQAEGKTTIYNENDIFVQDAADDMYIKKVELTRYVTRIELQVVNRDRTTRRFYLDPPLSRSSLILTDREMQQVFHITNIIKGKWGDTEIPTGGRATFVLEFERIPDDLRFFHMRSGGTSSKNPLNFYGIILKK